MNNLSEDFLQRSQATALGGNAMEKLTQAQLGAPLTQTEPDKPKIILHTVCRTAIAIFVCLAGSGGTHGMEKWFADVKGIIIFFFLWTVFLAIGLFPLIHLKDSLVFYENGICYRGICYLYSQLGSIRFRDLRSHIIVHNIMDTDLRTFDVTYLKRPKYYYHQANKQQTAPESSQTRF